MCPDFFDCGLGQNDSPSGHNLESLYNRDFLGQDRTLRTVSSFQKIKKSILGSSEIAMRSSVTLTWPVGNGRWETIIQSANVCFEDGCHLSTESSWLA